MTLALKKCAMTLQYIIECRPTAFGYFLALFQHRYFYESKSAVRMKGRAAIDSLPRKEAAEPVAEGIDGAVARIFSLAVAIIIAAIHKPALLLRDKTKIHRDFVPNPRHPNKAVAFRYPLRHDEGQAPAAAAAAFALSLTNIFCAVADPRNPVGRDFQPVGEPAHTEHDNS